MGHLHHLQHIPAFSNIEKMKRQVLQSSQGDSSLPMIELLCIPLDSAAQLSF